MQAVVFENLSAIASHVVSFSKFIFVALMRGRQTYFFDIDAVTYSLISNIYKNIFYLFLFFLTFELSPNSPFTPAFNMLVPYCSALCSEKFFEYAV